MSSSSRPAVDERSRKSEEFPNIDGVVVREDDIEPVKGLRTIAAIFRGLSIILLILMVLQVFFAMTSAVPLSPGVVVADAVRLVIFAGLLWGAGDLAVLFVKSHYDLRATRILMARVAHSLERGEKLDDAMDGRR
jgi:hypothetical protein